MQHSQTDVFVAGGGIAGMITALSFAALGFEVVCADPDTPITERTAHNADMRSTAFLQPAKSLLSEIGLWEHLEKEAAPLQIMRIIDAGGVTPEPRIQSEFDAREISDQPFGWNFPNWLLRRECVSMIRQHQNITFKTGVSVDTVFTRTSCALVTLSSGETIEARLLVAADGRNSAVRKSVGINVKTLRYGQKALAFSVQHPLAHQNVSTEIHRSGGPFTLVPLPDHDGLPASAVVWMERAPEALRLQNLPVADFEAALNERSCAILGPLKLTSPRSLWPIISQYADNMSAQRTALVAEAAHVVPPIGAQGLNMSLGDVRSLFDLAKAEPENLGNTQMLRAYHRSRHAEVRTRILGIDALNRASMVAARPLRDIRAFGLSALYGFKPVRQALMKAGLGVKL